jgi:septum formation protein
VEFFPLSEEQIKKYVDSKVAMDKAGAYGIQDKGALFIKGITGDYYTVMGLPIARVYQSLQKYL